MKNLRERHVEVLLGWFKEGPPGAIAVGGGAGLLQAVTWEDAGDPALMERLAGWRGCDPAAARAWLVEEVLAAGARALFWVKDGEGAIVGHVGLFHFDFARGAVEVGDVAGEGGAEGLLRAAAQALGWWAEGSFGVRAVGAARGLVGAAG